MSDMSVINSSTSDAIDQLVIDSGRMHKVINGTAAESVTVEDGSLIPSLRKALLENLYYQTPILPWVNGSTTQVFNQLYAFTEVSSGAVSWWYAPSATATNPVSMKASPATDANWRVVLDSATLTGLYATIDSPTFTGVPLAPTVDVDDNSDSIATTKFVNALIAKILQDVTMVDAEVANLTVTGDAEIFNLTTPTANITGKLTVQDLEILGDVTGIQTSVDGEDIAPKSITTTDNLEVGGNTILQGTFQLADKTIMLGDGTIVDLTNIGTATSIEVAQNLNTEVGNKNFVWDATTLNSPITGTSGKGISISKNADEVTQVTWPDGEPSAWVRNLSAGSWSAWESAVGSVAEAMSGASTTVAVSPAGVKAFVAQYGIGMDEALSVTDLNTVLVGQTFNYDVGALNAPTASVAGRGALFVASTGNSTMLVIENVNNKMFLRYNTAGVWGAWKEFEGKQGEPGEQGNDGIQGEAGLSAYDVYVKNLPDGEDPLTEQEWLDSLQGSSFTVNATGETSERAAYDGEAKGFSFLDTTTGMLYIKNSATSGDWSDGIPFKGDKGDPGLNGSTWFSGATVPATSLGVNGDFYLKTDTDDVYKKSAGAWAIITNIKGTKGDDGDVGNDGADGATWLSGAVAPVAGDGKDGDFYLNTATFDVSKKTSGAWAVIVNLKGPKGDAGADGSVWLTGDTVPENTVGKEGDVFLLLDPTVEDGPNGDVYQKLTGSWTLVGNIRGPASDSGGGGGGDAAKWYNGTGIPVNTLGANGDYYLQTTTVNTAAGNGDVYAKSAGVWTKQGNIKGADGSGSGTLPIATATVLGGVKIGTGVTVAADGTISTPIFATTDEAKAATSTTVMMSPTRVREFMENHGLTATFTTQATNLDLVVTGDFFNYAATTLNRPGTGGYGRGICIPSGTGYVTQFAIENDSNLMFIRYQTNGTWGAWTQAGGSGGSVTFATTAEAQAATSTTVAMSPARTREQFEPLGFGSISLPVTANLNTLTKGQFFNWDNTSTNSPVASSYGRGIMIAGGGSYNTQIGIINDTGAMYIRYSTAGTWGAWIAVGGGGSTAVMKPSGTGHAAGLAPDPGATAGTTKFLREDATWAVPAGGGGGAASPAGMMSADKSLNKTTKTNLGFTGSVMPVVGTVYQFKATILTQSTAAQAATFSLEFDTALMGAQIFRADCRSPNATGVITSSVSDQASIAVTGCNGPLQNGVTVVEGIVQFNYVGTAQPDIKLLLLTGDYMNILKGGGITYIPIGTIAL